jgi:uncharacterized protein YecE (DUF72 family)
MSHSVFLGCSGWAYASWKPGFYPAKTPSKQFLPYYTSQLNSVEVNYTFRQLPGPSMVENWLGSVQAGFQFSFKAPQSLTHFKRLRDCAEVVHAFYESLARFRDAGRMGVILFQLPPNFKADRERLAAFLKYASVKDQRIAFEFRHESWFGEDTFSTLRDHNAALCVAASDDLETPDIQTADFSCYRLRESEYSPKRLKQIAEDFKTRAATGQVYAYFKHEEEPSGPQRAREVLEMVRGL